MFVGHLGVGLALSSRSRRFRLGTLLGAALLLDVLLGIFVLAGMEQVIVPGGGSTPQASAAGRPSDEKRSPVTWA